MSPHSIIVSHPTANLFSRELALYLLQQNKLSRYVTSIAQKSKSSPRYLAPLLYNNTSTHSLREWGRLLSGKLRLLPFQKSSNYPFSIDAVYHSLDKFCADLIQKKSWPAEVVYAYEDGALETFVSARSLGLHCAYDLPIAHWKQRKEIYKETTHLYPAWAATIKGQQDSDEKLQRKERELETAHSVIVPSQFVKDSLPRKVRDSKQIILAPFGTTFYEGSYREEAPQNKTLKVLFAGSLSQRKGLADLCQAVESLGTTQIELIAAGSLCESLSFYQAQCSRFQYAGNLPHQKLLSLMQSCDVFCLPSISEGRALVIQEALGAGLPAIITPNTGCKDLIKNGENGFVIDIHSPIQIAETLEWCLNNRSSLREMRTAAKESVQAFTWEAYGRKICSALLNE